MCLSLMNRGMWSTFCIGLGGRGELVGRALSLCLGRGEGEGRRWGGAVEGMEEGVEEGEEGKEGEKVCWKV